MNHIGDTNKMVGEDHLPDTGKMVSDTPRTDAEMVEMTTGDGPVKTRTKWVHSSVCIQLERELNAANSRIELLMSANADVARIAGERDESEKRIRLLIAERDKYQDRIKRMEEFVEQLTNPKFTRDDLPKEALLQRIKRLEDAGDALKAAGYFGGFNDAVDKWIKVKEDKL